MVYKRWSTLQKIYYIQAEILSSAGAIHHSGRENTLNDTTKLCRSALSEGTIQFGNLGNPRYSEHSASPTRFVASLSEFKYHVGTNAHKTRCHAIRAGSADSL